MEDGKRKPVLTRRAPPHIKVFAHQDNLRTHVGDSEIIPDGDDELIPPLECSIGGRRFGRRLAFAWRRRYGDAYRPTFRLQGGR